MLDSVGADFDVNIREDVAGVREEASWNAGEIFNTAHKLEFGGEVELCFEKITFNVSGKLLDPGLTDYINAYVKSDSVNGGVYLNDRVRLNDSLEAAAGVRYDRDGSTGKDSISPRFSIRWKPDENTQAGAAWGRYSRFPEPVQTDEKTGNPGLRPDISEHTVVSVEKAFFDGFTGRVSVFYKTFSDMVLVTQDSMFYANYGKGTAKGVEVFLRADLGERFLGWFSYTFSRSERSSPPYNKPLLYHYDEPHNLTLIASYKISPAFMAGAKLQYNSGPLRKRFATSYKNAFFIADGLYDDFNEERLNDYLRIDARVDYVWKFEGWKLTAYLEVINILNRMNPQGMVYPDGISGEPVIINNLPVLPYIGIAAEF